MVMVTWKLFSACELSSLFVEFFSMYLRCKNTCIHVLSIKNDEKLIFHD